MPTNITVRGLDDRGFRIKNSGGNQAVVKAGTSVTVDVDDAAVANRLRRHNDAWVKAATGQAEIRGLRSTDGDFVKRGGFKVGKPAVLTTALTGTNNDLRFVAKTAGVGGNDITVAYVNPGGTAARSISVSGNAITVNLAVTAGAIDATETASSIKTALEANASASALVSIELASGNDGTGVVTAMAATNLAGGGSQRIEAGASAVASVDDKETQRSLRRNLHQWAVGTSNLISIKGLGDRGFRIKNSGGALVVVKRGGAAVTVNVDDGEVQRTLMRHHDEWIEA